MKKLTLKQIVKKYLTENGFDGLYNSDNACGCKKFDLFPCDGDGSYDCKPGYLGLLDGAEIIQPRKNSSSRLKKLAKINKDFWEKNND